MCSPKLDDLADEESENETLSFHEPNLSFHDDKALSEPLTEAGFEGTDIPSNSSLTGDTLPFKRSFIINMPIDTLPNEFGNEVGGVLTLPDVVVSVHAADAIEEDEDDVDGEFKIGETLVDGGCCSITAASLGACLVGGAVAESPLGTLGALEQGVGTFDPM